MCLSFCVFCRSVRFWICLFTCLSVFLSVSIIVCVPVHLCMCRSLSLSLSLSLCLSLHVPLFFPLESISISLPMHLSTYLAVNHSFYLGVCLSTKLFGHRLYIEPRAQGARSKPHRVPHFASQVLFVWTGSRISHYKNLY